MPSCLSIHASWHCRHAGACCRAGWAIPVDATTFELLRVHVGRARDLFVTGGPFPEGAAAILAAHPDGTCRFYEGRLCGIHRELGPDALPLACRQFPRQVLRDARGTFVALSHYCPTAAGLLLDGGPLTIVEAPPSLALDGRLEGLDATNVLPPLLRPDLLTDPAGYGHWERLAIAVLDSDRSTADDAIDRIGIATGMVTRWEPGRESLRDAVAAAFERASGAQAVASEESASQPFAAAEDDIRRYRTAVGAVPPGLTAPEPPPGATPPAWFTPSSSLRADRTLRAYLASRLFGNWIAYYASGLLTVVEYLRVCAAVLRVELARAARRLPGVPADPLLLEAVRHADLLLVHLADAPALTRSIEDDAHLRARTLSSLRHDRHALG